MGQLVSWDASSALGRHFRAALVENEAAVRVLCAQGAEDPRSSRIKQALGL